MRRTGTRWKAKGVDEFRKNGMSGALFLRVENCQLEKANDFENSTANLLGRRCSFSLALEFWRRVSEENLFWGGVTLEAGVTGQAETTLTQGGRRLCRNLV